MIPGIDNDRCRGVPERRDVRWRMRLWMRKFRSGLRWRRLARQRAREAFRLAETAPHLLRDVGFDDLPAPRAPLPAARF